MKILLQTKDKLLFPNSINQITLETFDNQIVVYGSDIKSSLYIKKYSSSSEFIYDLKKIQSNKNLTKDYFCSILKFYSSLSK